MPVLRYIHRLILTLWLGSIFFFAAAVAPALFRTLSGADSGAVVRELIPRIDAGGLLAGPLLIGLAWAVEGRPSGRARVRAVLWGTMAVLAAVSLTVVTPRLDRLRARAVPSISALPSDDPLRREFGALHGVSTLLMLGVATFGLVTLAWPLAKEKASA